MTNIHFEIQHKTSLEESSLKKTIIGRGVLQVSPFKILNEHKSVLFSIPISSNSSHSKMNKKP